MRKNAFIIRTYLTHLILPVVRESLHNKPRRISHYIFYVNPLNHAFLSTIAEE